MNKLELWASRLMSWEGIIVTLILIATLSLLGGCSTSMTWESEALGKKVGAEWGVAIEDVSEDE